MVDEVSSECSEIEDENEFDEDFTPIHITCKEFHFL